MSNHTVTIDHLASCDPFERELASMFASGARKRLIALLFVSAEDGSDAVAYRVISGGESQVFTRLTEAVEAYNQADGRTM